jgi:hypothetical protein
MSFFWNFFGLGPSEKTSRDSLVSVHPEKAFTKVATSAYSPLTKAISTSAVAADTASPQIALLKQSTGFSGAFEQSLAALTGKDKVLGHGSIDIPDDSLPDRFAALATITHFRTSFIPGQTFVGPIDQVLTLAPKERVEVSFIDTRTLTRDTETTNVSERQRTSEQSNKDSSDLSRRVSQTVTESRNTSQSVGLSGGNTGVWSAKASADTSVNVTSQLATETVDRKMREILTKEVQDQKTTLTIRTRVTESESSTNTTVRKIENDSETCLTYGVRRLYRMVDVQTRDMGPQLAFFIALPNPSEGLTTGRSLHHPILDIPLPGTLKQGEDLQVQMALGGGAAFSGETVLNLGTTVLSSVRGIEIITCVVEFLAEILPPEHGNKVTFKFATGPVKLSLNQEQVPPISGAGFFFDFKTGPGNLFLRMRNDGAWRRGERNIRDFENGRIFPGASATITYRLLFDSGSMEVVEKQGDVYVTALQGQIKAERSTAKRNASELRDEEHNVLLSRMLRLTGSDSVADEVFDGLFDFETMFYRLVPKSDGAKPAEAHYFVTADSNAAPFGQSLGWKLQPDGDRRRNEFINAKSALVLLPIRRGSEKEALDWLIKNGQVIIDSQQKERLISQYETFNAAYQECSPWFTDQNDGALGELVSGNPRPWVEKPGDSSHPIHAPAKERYNRLFPVVGKNQVSVPVDGFLYDIVSIEK